MTTARYVTIQRTTFAGHASWLYTCMPDGTRSTWRCREVAAVFSPAVGARLAARLREVKPGFDYTVDVVRPAGSAPATGLSGLHASLSKGF